jgi:hypothetical protein
MTSQTKLTKDLIFKMVPQVTTKVNGRSKRALLPFVGDIASNLFGVATEGDVRKLASHINALTKQNNKIVGALNQYGGNFASFLTQTDKLISNAMQGIKTNALVLDRLRILIEKNSQYSNYFVLQASQNQYLNELQNYLFNLKTSVTDLAEGKLSPLIITPSVLQPTIQNIQVILDKDYNGYKILTSDPNYYYKYASFTILRNDSTLYISIKFLITTHGKLFQTYNVLSFPVEVNSTHNHAT